MLIPIPLFCLGKEVVNKSVQDVLCSVRAEHRSPSLVPNAKPRAAGGEGVCRHCWVPRPACPGVLHEPEPRKGFKHTQL